MNDSLSMTSTVQEILRAIYRHGVDYILLSIGKQERLLHKDQLVALLEQGRDDVSLDELQFAELKELLSAKMQMEDVPPATPLLLFAMGELIETSFGAYRQQKIMAAAAQLPAWWEVPLPLLYVKGEIVSLNGTALTLIPGGAKALAGQLDRLLLEKYITLNEGKLERTLTLTPLTDEVFFLEDISGDFEMAEDLVWWAAVGRAFVSRMEGNGLAVRRLSQYEDEPKGAAEVIPCRWDGELVGRLALILPAQTAVEAIPEEDISETGAVGTGEDAAEDMTPPTPVEESDKPAEAAEKKTSRRAKKRKTVPEPLGE